MVSFANVTELLVVEMYDLWDHNNPHATVESNFQNLFSINV
jgi:hypothetical protein